jgi:hypothetical protein
LDLRTAHYFGHNFLIRCPIDTIQSGLERGQRDLQISCYAYLPIRKISWSCGPQDMACAPAGNIWKCQLSRTASRPIKGKYSRCLRDLLFDLWTPPSTWETREGPRGLFGVGSSRISRETRPRSTPARQIRGSRVVSVLLLMNSLFYLLSCCMNMRSE